MDELIEILEDIKPDVDYEGCENLIDGHYLDSLSIISLIAFTELKFAGTTSTAGTVTSKASSISAIREMIERESR